MIGDLFDSFFFRSLASPEYIVLVRFVEGFYFPLLNFFVDSRFELCCIFPENKHKKQQQQQTNKKSYKKTQENQRKIGKKRKQRTNSREKKTRKKCR